MKYKTIAAGGTFDHLHKGHKVFLLWLFDQAESVLLGITTDEFAQKTKNDPVTDFDIRKKSVEDFLKEQGLSDKVTIVPIDNMYGPLLAPTPKVDAIGVTEETHDGAVEINKKRQEKGFSSLPIMTLPLVQEKNEVISSSNIRSGKINHEGKLWVDHIWRQQDYILPDHLRHTLQEPFGELIEEIPEGIPQQKTITVGDVTTKLFTSQVIQPHLAIIDFIVERRPMYHAIEEFGFSQDIQVLQVTNPSGHIMADVWELIEKSIHASQQSVLHVRGEEDLLVLPSILLAPLSYHIFYGQPHVGLVHIEITQEIKMKAYAVMTSFSRI